MIKDTKGRRLKDKIMDVLLRVHNYTQIATLFTFIFRFSSINLIHMMYFDYTDIIFTLSLQLKQPAGHTG